MTDPTHRSPTGCPVSHAAATFDPFGDAFQQDPPACLRWSRDQEPVFYSPLLGYWVVTRYDSVKAIFRDHETFSPSIALEKITPTSAEANAVLAAYGFALNRTLVNEDEPAHMPRRRALMEPFTPAEIERHEPLARRLAREYVDRFIDTGRADLVDQMLWEVPLTVALHFLGIPEDDMDTLRRYSIAHTVNTWGRPAPEQQVAVAHAVGNFWRFAGGLLDRMRQNPDAPGWMPYGIRQQKLQPEVVTDSYLHSMMMAGIVAAHETTANASANAIKLLLETPGAWRALHDDPALIPNAVEECLRHNGSIAAWRRLATRATRIDGVEIPAGAKLLIVTASANRDERRFDDADGVDLRRDDAVEHLTFGHGAHQCMGQHLARMEMRVFLEELTRRLPHARLAEQRFSYLPNTSFRGPEHLWLEWEPALNPERADPSVRDGRRSATDAAGGSRDPLTTARAPGREALVERVTPIARGIVLLRLVAPGGQAMPRWSPGSHIEIECGASGPMRAYSLCGDPADAGALEIAVRLEEASRGGSAWVHHALQAGERLRFRGPRNRFRLDEDTPAGGPATSPRRWIFLAGGIGITPIAAMARRARALGVDYELHYSGRQRAGMALVDELAALHGERLLLHVSEEGRRHDLAALLPAPPDAAHPDPRLNTRVYACGPARLLDELAEHATRWPEGTLRVEHFEAAAGPLDPAREHAFEVELAESRIVVPVRADQSLLAALRDARVEVRSDCEEGLCGACEVAVLDGAIDHRDRVLTPAERDGQRKMMACCSRARGGRLVLRL